MLKLVQFILWCSKWRGKGRSLRFSALKFGAMVQGWCSKKALFIYIITTSPISPLFLRNSQERRIIYNLIKI
jgi:hypothetical protein